MLVTFKSHLGSKVKLRVTVILSLQNKVFSVNTSFLFDNAVHSLHRTVLSSHLRLAVLKPMALVKKMFFGNSTSRYFYCEKVIKQLKH